MTDFRRLCAEMVHLNDHPATDHAEWSEAIDRVRAALALPNDLSHLSEAEFQALCPQGYHAVGDDAEPQGEVAELVNSLRHSGDALRVYGLHGAADDCTHTSGKD